VLLPEERSFHVDHAEAQDGGGNNQNGSPAESSSEAGGADSPALTPSSPSSSDASPSGRRQVEVLLNFTLQVLDDALVIINSVRELTSAQGCMGITSFTRARSVLGWAVQDLLCWQVPRNTISCMHNFSPFLADF